MKIIVLRYCSAISYDIIRAFEKAARQLMCMYCENSSQNRVQIHLAGLQLGKRKCNYGKKRSRK